MVEQAGEVLTKDEKQLIINVTADKVVRLLPALNISQADADEIVNRLVPLISNFIQSKA